MEFPTVNIYDDVSSSSEDNIDITNIHPVPKKTRGRRKIQMKKIKKDTDMMVTFSKRRFGIYKKASELVTLTGSEIAFLVFSPAGNAFTFAHPSFDFLVTKYLGIQHLDPSIISYETIHVLQQDRINELTVRYTNSLKNLENEQRKEKDLSARCHGKSLNNWWNRCIDDVTTSEIQELQSAYMDFNNKIDLRRMEVMLEINNPSVDMGLQTGLIMNMGQPRMAQSLPNFSMCSPSEAVNSGSMVGPNGGGGGAEASDPFSIFGSGGGGNESSVDYSSSTFTI